MPNLLFFAFLGFIDYIVSNKLYNFYLVDACVDGTKDYEFVLKLSNPKNNPWSNPIKVMGYNDAFPVAGDLFEADTDCNSLHNMGQAASLGFNNLSFLKRDKPYTLNRTLKQNESPSLMFNSSKVYLAFTIGDGDNLSFLKAARRDWMIQRVQNCLQNIRFVVA